MDTSTKTNIGFNIYTQINTELDSFFSNKLHLAGKQPEGSVKYLNKQNSTYLFNQAEMLDIIDMYWNSKFTTGDLDDQGREKLFLNVGKFRSEVASKQIDIDTKDFVFIPEDYASTIGAWLMQQEFKDYVKTTYFGELVNECVEALPKYGSVVLKKVADRLEFVPLQTLRNEQSAKDLQTASYVIEEHTDMTMGEIQAKKKDGWSLEGFSLPFGQTCTVYERSGFVPLWYLNDLNKVSNDGVDTNEVVDALIICTITKTHRSKKNTETGHVFFAKQVSTRPYREAHWSKQYGRWLGVGEMENQIPNQVAKNVLVNILKNGFDWSSKRLFQTEDEAVANNLAKEVKDGDVLLVSNTGHITQIDMAARYGTEAQQLINEWENNSNQKSFTYDVVTGDSTGSNIPFRLGVVYSNAANSHFAFKREKFGFVLKKAVIDFLIPEFKKKAISGKSVILMRADMPGFEVLRAAAEDYTTSQVIRASILSGKLIDMNLINQLVDPIKVANELFIQRPADFYSTIETKFDLTLTSEEVDLQKKITSLTTLYQVLSARQDPRADAVLARVLALSGENMAMFGSATAAPLIPAQNGAAPVKVNMPAEKPKSSLAIPKTTQDEGSD